jgi:GTP-binding protein
VEEFHLMDWLHDHQVPTILVLTKADKLSKTKQQKQCRNAAETLGVDMDDLLLFSAKSGKGKEALWELIEQVIG